jgi:hypothetical protein
MPQLGQPTKRHAQLRRQSCGTFWHSLDANQTLPKKRTPAVRISLPKFIGLINSPSHYLHLLDQQTILPIFLRLFPLPHRVSPRRRPRASSPPVAPLPAGLLRRRRASSPAALLCLSVPPPHRPCSQAREAPRCGGQISSAPPSARLGAPLAWPGLRWSAALLPGGRLRGPAPWRAPPAALPLPDQEAPPVTPPRSHAAVVLHPHRCSAPMASGVLLW